MRRVRGRGYKRYDFGGHPLAADEIICRFTLWRDHGQRPLPVGILLVYWVDV